MPPRSTNTETDAVPSTVAQTCGVRYPQPFALSGSQHPVVPIVQGSDSDPVAVASSVTGRKKIQKVCDVLKKVSVF